MYRTKIFWAANVEEMTNLQLATSSSTSVSVSITYAASATMKNGAPALVDPETRTFTQSTLGTLRGYYIKLDDVVYLIPSDATVSRVSSSGKYVWRASKAQKIINTDLTLYSGVGTKNAIRSCKITYESNDGDDLMLGSVCTAMLEAKIVSQDGDLSIGTGAEVTVYKVAEDGTENQIGVFTCEQPTKLTANTYKILAYDNVRKLDRDITGWLRGLTEWPYALTEFFGMLATECGVEYYPIGDGSSAWNGSSSFMVHRFDVSDGTTGRQLMGAICEVMGDYCIAQPDGKLTANWYRVGYIKLYPTAKAVESGNEYEQHWLQNSLSYGDFNVQDVGYVQIREEQSEDVALWPDYGTDADVSNAYIITGNPILMAHPTYLGTSTATNSVRNALTKIASRFDYTQYRPFKVTIPELPMARAGMYVQFFENENSIYPTFIAPITSMKWSGHKMTLECTAKQTRSTADSPENWSNTQLAQYSDRVISRTPQEQLFEKMAGSTPGVNLTDGKIFTDKDFRHSGHTVEHYGTDCWYYSASDNDEKSLEAWMDGHLSEMPAYSSRTLVFGCYPAISGPRICGTLYRDETTNNAVFYGASYGSPVDNVYGSICLKAKAAGVWYPMKRMVIGG